MEPTNGNTMGSVEEPGGFEECTGCMEYFPPDEGLITDCNHNYCQKCCKEPIPPEKFSYGLPPGLDKTYRERLEIFYAKDKTYCSRDSCTLPIYSHRFKGEIGTCSICQEKTCVECKRNAREGECKIDDDKEFLDFVKTQGWQKCPSCSIVVERRSGCNHMTCVCRAEWCYFCGSEWHTCDCKDDGLPGDGDSGSQFDGINSDDEMPPLVTDNGFGEILTVANTDRVVYFRSWPRKISLCCFGFIIGTCLYFCL